MWRIRESEEDKEKEHCEGLKMLNMCCVLIGKG